jgi:hypothetical protein
MEHSVDEDLWLEYFIIETLCVPTAPVTLINLISAEVDALL